MERPSFFSQVYTQNERMSSIRGVYFPRMEPPRANANDARFLAKDAKDDRQPRAERMMTPGARLR